MSGAVVIHTRKELEALEAQVAASAKRTADSVRELLSNSEPMLAFAAMKFEQSGFHPTADRPLNFIEQINQTFSFIASVRATAWLMERYPKVQGYRLNLGATPGSDIESLDGQIAAETFASVDPRNNRKLESDIAKVATTRASHKYVFFICPNHPRVGSVSVARGLGVKVVPLVWKTDT